MDRPIYDAIPCDRGIENALKEGGYKLVYQGGRHSVYCNGDVHMKTSGGYTGLTEKITPFFKRGTREPYTFKCDCEAYNRR